MKTSKFKIARAIGKLNKTTFDKRNNKPQAKGGARYDRIDKAHHTTKSTTSFRGKSIVTCKPLTLRQHDEALASKDVWAFRYGQPKKL
jgi:hypothetical protein